MARRFVIHIGANKTASSTFQDHLFARHRGVHYLGEDGEGYETYRDLVDSMVSDDDLYFQRDACAQFFEKHRTLDTGKTLSLLERRHHDEPDADGMRNSSASTSLWSASAVYLPELPR